MKGRQQPLKDDQRVCHAFKQVYTYLRPCGNNRLSGLPILTSRHAEYPTCDQHTRAAASAAPSGTVQQGTLTAPSIQTQDAFPTAPEAPTIATEQATNETEIASLPTGGGGPISREQMVGAWKVGISGSTCQMFLALTKWSGGFRAASRGCLVQRRMSQLECFWQSITAKRPNGGTVAVLLASGPTRYAGSASGTPITLSR